MVQRYVGHPPERERERERERETPASLILGDVRLCTGGLLEWEPVDEGGGFSRNWQYLISTVDFEKYNFAVHQGRASDRQENTAGGGTGKKPICGDCVRKKHKKVTGGK